MIIVKSPFRISLFGGSTDYESFYKNYGSFIIGTTINKYVYLSMRKRPIILSKESIIMYSKLQSVQSFDEIENPLIKEILKFREINFPIEFMSYSDVPSRTGLGGSSSFCVGMLYLIDKILKTDRDKNNLVKDAIKVERELLNEPGGIQDSIWPAHGGFNSLEIKEGGDVLVKPLPVTKDFLKEIEDSMVLIYTNSQRNQNEIAKSHDKKDKRSILNIAKEAYSYFISENLKEVGGLMYESWNQKRSISNMISNEKIDGIINDVMKMGAYGAKLLGTGGCGFILTMCDLITKNKIIEKFKDNIMDFQFEKDGVSCIYHE